MPSLGLPVYSVLWIHELHFITVKRNGHYAVLLILWASKKTQLKEMEPLCIETEVLLLEHYSRHLHNSQWYLHLRCY